MNRLSINPVSRRYSYLFAWSFVLLLVGVSTQLRAQTITPDCNAVTSLTVANPTSATSSLSVETSDFGVFPAIFNSYVNANNLIDANTNNTATKATLAVTGTHWIEVRYSGPNSFTGGSYVGFVVNNSELAALGSSIKVSTYNSTSLVEESTNSNTLISSSLFSGRGKVGFLTTEGKNFNRIRFTYSSIVDLGTINLYYAFVEKFCSGPALVCSKTTSTTLTNPTYPVFINDANTGISGLCAGCSINNPDNVISQSTTTPATINLGLGIGSSVAFSVANALDTYPAETFAGFDIASSSLLAANIGGSVTITLYNNGSAVQTGTGASLLVGATVATTNRTVVGTVAQVPFDEIKIQFTNTGVDLGTISVYRAVVQKACVTAVACNQTRYLNRPDFSSFIEGTRTGFRGLGTLTVLPGLNGIENPENVISASLTDFAQINNTVSGSATASISVADPADVYPVGTFAGYTISKVNFPVMGDLLAKITVRTYLNGTLQESSTPSTLTDLLVIVQIFGSPSTLSNVGFYATKPFDEIQLEVGSFASVASFVRVYGAFIDTRFSTNGSNLVCNFALNPDFNVTTKGVPVSGNVSTNDIGTSGSSYGLPVVVGTPPAGAIITMNTNGTYSFTATAPGSYTYNVPVCATAPTNCPTTLLVIKVLDPFVATNPPVANPDYATVLSSTAVAGSVTINVLANDGPGNAGGTLTSPPTVTVNPTFGTAIVNGSGNVVYTPQRVISAMMF